MGIKSRGNSAFFRTIFVVLFLISFILSFSHATSRLMRYEKLYKTYQCTFPPSNSIPPLFGPNSYLSKCNSIGDPLNKTKTYELSASLCQSLLDELLVVCHDNNKGASYGIDPTAMLDSMKTVPAGQLCNDPIIKKHPSKNDWKLLNEFTICSAMCADNLWLCRMRIFLWKFSDSTAAAAAAATTPAPKKSNNSTPSGTFPLNKTNIATTPAHPKKATPVVTSSPSELPTTSAPTTKSFQQTMQNILKNGASNSGSHTDGNTQGSVSNTSIHEAVKDSSRIGAKLFILFGVCSLIFVVVGYVMFYKRKQWVRSYPFAIRAFCCEDQGDVRYRRIREDRNQQAAQPLKNMNNMNF